MPRDPAPEHAAFILTWNATDSGVRRHVRRLVRLGQPVDSRDEAELAMGFADYQRTRLWFRLFWLWFVPGVLFALAAASSIHPILIGVVLASAGTAVLARRNIKRVAKVNAELLDAPT